MLVSWKWLSRYLDLSMTPDQLANSLSLSGLNHESTSQFEGDTVIDLEVTSNRGDCLSHLGVAREIAVLYDLAVKAPNPTVKESAVKVDAIAQVSNQFTEACPRYTARVIQGVKVKTSPLWLQQLLLAIGVKPVNNIVDITNYVMMEMGQPLHAFDYDELAEHKIVIRSARKKEVFEAIDHRSYILDETMCVIADAEKAVAIAGVMGGAESEVTDKTTSVILEAAIFTPMSVRQTARTLKLHSPSSFRFERRLDPVGVDLASRRACELILELAGGQLAAGVIDTAPEVEFGCELELRVYRVNRLLGIEIPPPEIVRILTQLGCEVVSRDSALLQVSTPSWRHDLTREVDLIEEVARIHGYDKIPEDSPIAVAPSSKRDFDHATEKIRSILLAAGISEAMTPSIVTESLDKALSPWSELESLQTQTPLLKGANRLRRSLLPSLLQCRSDNWAAASIDAELYEIAHVYLPAQVSGELPAEQYNLGLITGRDFFAVKGIIERLLVAMGINSRLDVKVEPIGGFDAGQSVWLQVDSKRIGFLGTIDRRLSGQMKLPGTTTVAEISLPTLLALATLVPQHQSISQFPSIARDLNMIVAEQVHWVDLENSTRSAIGSELSKVEYLETYRAPEKDGDNTKRILYRVELQRPDATLTGEEADALTQSIIKKCETEHAARLLV